MYDSVTMRVEQSKISSYPIFNPLLLSRIAKFFVKNLEQAEPWLKQKFRRMRALPLLEIEARTRVKNSCQPFDRVDMILPVMPVTVAAILPHYCLPCKALLSDTRRNECNRLPRGGFGVGGIYNTRDPVKRASRKIGCKRLKRLPNSSRSRLYVLVPHSKAARELPERSMPSITITSRESAHQEIKPACQARNRSSIRGS